MTLTREYSSWRNMRNRCLNPSNKDYPNYGGRGITIDPAWDDFKVFLKELGPRPEGTTLDRIDVNGDYSLSNCKWSTPKEQAANRRIKRKPRNTSGKGVLRMVDFFGDLLTLREISTITGLSVPALKWRLKKSLPLCGELPKGRRKLWNPPK